MSVFPQTDWIRLAALRAGSAEEKQRVRGELFVRAVKAPGQLGDRIRGAKASPGSSVTQALTCPAAVAVFAGTGIIRPEMRDITPPEPARRSP